MNVMKQKLVTICILVSMFFCQGCPDPDDGGFILDTPMYIQNTIQDSIQVRPYLKTLVGFSDSILSIEDKAQIYLFVNDSTRLFSLSPLESREWIRVSMERIVQNPDGLYVYLINPDTLLNYSPATWNGVAGVKRYFFYNLEDYQQIDFTLEYP